MHCPVTRPETMFFDPPESPNWGAGSLLEQCRPPAIVLVATSFPSGSAVTLLLKATLPDTDSRKNPSQHDRQPVMETLPPIVSSSYVAYAGDPKSGGWGSQLTPPPPPLNTTFPLSVL